MASEGDGRKISATEKRSERRISGIGRYGYRLSGGSFKGRFGSSPSSTLPPANAVRTTSFSTASSQVPPTSSAYYPPIISLTSSTGAYSNLTDDVTPISNESRRSHPSQISTSLSRHLSLSQKRQRSPRTSNSFLSSNNGSDSGASSARSSANASPRSSLTNKIGDYASRYLDTIRPKWGSSSGAAARAAAASRSTSSSRSESPLNVSLGGGAIPYVSTTGISSDINPHFGHKASSTYSTSSTAPHASHSLTYHQRDRLSPSTSYATSGSHLLQSDLRQKRSFSPSLKPVPSSGSDWYGFI